MYLAQRICIGGSGQCIDGPLPADIQTIGNVVNIVYGFLIPLGGVVLLLVLIWGGYTLMLSSGNPEKIKSAKAKITAGIIGFILLVGSFLMVKIIAFIFNLGQGIF